MQLVQHAQGVIAPHFSEDMEEVCTRIRVLDDRVPAEGAVHALFAISRALKTQPVKAAPGALERLKEAQRMVRDIIVFRIKSACEDKKDRKEFLKRADEAYGWILTTKEEDYEELQSQLFLAYHKLRTQRMLMGSKARMQKPPRFEVLLALGEAETVPKSCPRQRRRAAKQTQQVPVQADHQRLHHL